MRTNVIGTIAAIALVMSGIGMGRAASVDSGQILLDTDFETNPSSEGWIFAAKNGLGAWSTNVAHSGKHSVRLANAELISPKLSQPSGLYRFTFYERGGPGHELDWSGASRPLFFPSTSDWTKRTIVRRSSVLDLTGLYGAPLYVDDVQIAKINLDQANQAFSDLFADLPPFDFSAYQRAGRLENIPNTMARLAAGDDLTVVMLGDSIVNDTSRSFLDLHLERMYPGSQVDVIPAIRGSTGAWWYKEENRVQSYVLDHDPDLLMIGGISNHDDVDSIREVIEQVRAGNPQIEIVLMTGAVGPHDPAERPEDLLPIDPNGTDYRAQLWQLAQEQQTGFLDMTQPWARFVANSGKPASQFMRDAFHADYEGTVVLGRILESYFAPVPEPGTGFLFALGMALLLSMQRPRIRASH